MGMALVSFLSRLLILSVFVLTTYQQFNEFGDDGGPEAKALKQKLGVFSKHIKTEIGYEVPHIETKHLIMGAIVVKSLGSLLFFFGSTTGASILFLHQLHQAIMAPIVYEFFNKDVDEKEFAQNKVKFTQDLALLGALLFFIGTKTLTPRRSTKRTQKAKTN